MEKKENIGYLLFLSAIAAMGGFLFGYDTAVISGTISRVTEQFGLTPSGQGWYVGCALIGSIIGVSVAGIMSDRFGRKSVLVLAALLFTVSAAGCALSGSFDELVIYRIIGGLGIGIVSIVSPLYISEISVARYRGGLISVYQLAITAGFLGAYLVNYGLLSISSSSLFEGQAVPELIFSKEVWRGMLGMGVVPAVSFIFILLFIPESPRWLLLNRREIPAKKVLNRIYRDKEKVEMELDSIRKIIGNDVKTEWRALLSSKALKLILIGASIAILGQFMGVNAVLYYGPTIFQQNGLSDGDSLFYQSLIGLVNMLATILGLVIIDRVGRKKLLYFGVTGMFITLISIAFFFQKGTEWGMPSILLLIAFLSYIFFCAVSICLVVWVILAEIYPIKIRGLAMSIAGIFLWIGTYLVGQLTPNMLGTLGTTGTFLLFACVCIPYILIARYLLPETTGRSLEEIEKEMNE